MGFQKVAFVVVSTLRDSISAVHGQGDPACWGYGLLSFEHCCLPPREECWDGAFTEERCCGFRKTGTSPDIITRLRDELFTDTDPYAFLASACGQVYQSQLRYPDSHLTPAVVRSVLSFVPAPALWVEVGSFVGNSAITTANTFKELGMNTGIVCIDPFTGVVDMWSTRKALRQHLGLDKRSQGVMVADGPLLLDEFGHSRIYEMFLANVNAFGHQDIVMPLRASSITGLRLLRVLHEEGRIDHFPKVIYLDSAHEPDETYLEVREAWRLLDVPGVLFGDDWSWPGVRDDVTRFAAAQYFRNFSEEELRRLDWQTREAIQPVPGLAVVEQDDGFWMMLKDKTYE